MHRLEKNILHHANKQRQQRQLNKLKHPLLYKGFLIKQDKVNNKYYGHRLSDSIYLNAVYITWPQLKSVIDVIN